MTEIPDYELRAIRDALRAAENALSETPLFEISSQYRGCAHLACRISAILVEARLPIAPRKDHLS